MGPMNLPEGSVRSYLVLGLVFTVSVMALMSRPIPEGLMALASAGLGYYVGSRNQSPPTAPTGTA